MSVLKSKLRYRIKRRNIFGSIGKPWCVELLRGDVATVMRLFETYEEAVHYVSRKVR